MQELSKFKKNIISFFIYFNVFLTLFCNSPQRIRNPVNKCINSIIKPQKESDENFIFKALRIFSAIVGTSRWYMFNSTGRSNWWYVIKASYKDLSIVAIPPPIESKRTFLERNFFDCREPKAQNNLTKENFRQKRYGPYLCRKYKKNNNSKIKDITFELYEQKVIEPKYISKEMSYLELTVTKTFLGKVNCLERKSR